MAQKILTTLKRHFDLVLVDTGDLRDVVVITVENADRIFLVTTPSISSLRNVYELVRIFEGLKVDPAKINIILNAVKRSIDTNEIKKYIPYEIALKVPYIKQVEEKHDNYEFALENKRFRLYLDELLEDIVGTLRGEDFGHFERVVGMNLPLERLKNINQKRRRPRSGPRFFEEVREEFFRRVLATSWIGSTTGS